MGKPLDTRVVEYAYEANSLVTANSESDGKFYSRVVFTYDLLDSDRNHLGIASRSHDSEPSNTRRTAQEVTDWLAENRVDFIAADKLELAAYEV